MVCSCNFWMRPIAHFVKEFKQDFTFNRINNNSGSSVLTVSNDIILFPAYFTLGLDLSNQALLIEANHISRD